MQSTTSSCISEEMELWSTDAKMNNQLQRNVTMKIYCQGIIRPIFGT